MTETNMTLIELLQKHDQGDFLRAVTESVLQTLMEHDVEGVIGAGRYERGEDRQTYRNGYRDRALKTRLTSPALVIPPEMSRSPDWLREGVRPTHGPTFFEEVNGNPPESKGLHK
mgnify:CR=1 FL=1